MEPHQIRRHRSGEEKAELVLLALAGRSTGDLGREHTVSQTLLCRWRAEFIAAGTERLRSLAEREEVELNLIERLHRDVGELERALGRKTVEADRLRELGARA